MGEKRVGWKSGWARDAEKLDRDRGRECREAERAIKKKVRP